VHEVDCTSYGALLTVSTGRIRYL